MTDEQARKMLDAKWIAPIVAGLEGLPTGVVDSFISKIDALATKYEVTYAQVADEIRDAEKSLVEMIGNLTGGEYDMRGLAEFQTLLGGE